LHLLNRSLVIPGIAYLAGFVLLWISFLGSEYPVLVESLVGPIGLAPWSISPAARGALFGSAVLFLGAGYLLSIGWAFSENVTSLRIRKARLFVIFLLFLFLFLPIFLSFDAISYYHQGWVAAYQKANPYFTTPGGFPDPPGKYLPYETNLYALSPYGPLWVLIEGFIYRMSNGSLWLGVFLFKVLSTVASLILTFFVARVARALNPKYEIASMIFLGAHPLLLVEGPGMAHIDVMTLAVITLGIYLQWHYRSKVWIGALFLTAAVLLKGYAVPCLFVFFWWVVRNGEPVKSRSLRIVQAVIPAAALFAIASIPYIGSLSDIPRLLGYSAAELSVPFTPVALFEKALSQALGWIGVSFPGDTVHNVAQGFGIAVGLALILVILYRVFSLEDAFMALGPVYLVVNMVFSYWRQWYALWPLALVAVFPSRKWAWVIAVYCWLALCTYLVTPSSGISPLR